MKRKRFLTAEWRHLVMLNYPVERELLEPHVPKGTVLDTYQGKAYVSVVGFLFLKTRVLGIPIPLHQDFEEVNLRFYVRRFAEGDWRRGVVFIKELVPKPAIAALARTVYNERYQAVPMRHDIENRADGTLRAVEYGWEVEGRWGRMRAEASGCSRETSPGSLEEFITEHCWGYVQQRDGSCMEYEVEHPRWEVWTATNVVVDGDIASTYGKAFVPALSQPPASAFIADGSAVTVYRGHKLPA